MEKIKETILIIDDSKEYIQLLIEQLDNSYKYIATTNGEKALELARKTPQPDIILLDILMPGLDGYDVCKMLKLEKTTNHIPVLFMTALTDKEDKIKGLSYGAIDFISKPFDIELVKIRIRNQLELTKYQNKLSDMLFDSTKELKITQALLIESLGIIAEYRDPETGGHIKRTQNYVKALAAALMNNPEFEEQLTTDDVELLHQSAALHDIGKVGVPDNILLKTGKLTNEEFDEMKKHSFYGHKMLQKTMQKLPNKSFLRYSLEITHTHHEKWDGTGYPNGLKGKGIPLSGRLMAIADVYDALISKRCYKEAFSHEKAIEIINMGKGTQFDPDIVDEFLNIEYTIQNIAFTYADYEEEKEKIPLEKEVEGKCRKRILIVDDNEINLEIMKNQIEFLGYCVTTALSGSIALNKIKQGNYDLVLTDLDMPDMDGYELVKKIHQVKPQLPVIAETASDYDLTPEKFRDLGFSGYLLKPFDEEVLKKKLENI